MHVSQRWMGAFCIAAAATVSVSAQAAVFTVGPGGTHTTIQAALDAATASAETSEVRIAAGTYAENLAPSFSPYAFAVTVTGGWNAAFTARVTNPAATVVDGTNTGQCLRMSVKDQTLMLEGLTFTRGGGGGEGAVTIIATGASVVQVRHCRFVDNEVQSDQAAGGGLLATAADTTTLVIADCVVAGNALECSDGQATGAGLWVAGYDSGSIELARNVIADNTAATDGRQVTAVGLYLNVDEAATAMVHDNLIARNLVTTPGGGPAIGSGAVLWANNSAQISATRNAVLGNGTSTGAGQEQLSVSCNDASSVIVTDSLIAAPADINTSGVYLSGRDTSTIRMTNCTVADHNLTGVSARVQDGVVTITNTIVAGNTRDTQLDDGVVVSDSMTGGDPVFVDPAHWDYRLQWSSPARDDGTNTPPAGLGATDLAGTQRIWGGTVDQGAFEYRQELSRFPVVTHAFGFGGTPWRSTVAATNLSAGPAGFDMTFTSDGAQQVIGTSVQAAEATSFPDVVVSPLGFAGGEQHSGSLELKLNSPGVVFSSRTFANPGGGMGTYGQYLAAVAAGDMLAGGETAMLPLVRSDAGYYANIGMVNGGDSLCVAEVRLFDASGSQVGSTRTISAAAWEWAQLSDVFAVAGAGTHSIAYATVTVTSAGGAAWFYASVIDRTTKDPTTVPMQTAFAAGTVLRLPAAAHIAGIGGTPWRTTFGVVNTGAGTATVTLVYRSGATVVTKTVSIAAGAVRLWDDLLVDLFEYGQGASTAGTVELWADQPVAVAGRSYADKGAAGTYGQFLPALDAAAHGTGSLVAGVLTQLTKNAAFYTNVGFQNLGREDCAVRVTLFDSLGAQIGSPVARTVPAGQWLQVNDVFGAAGGGGGNLAYAVVEVLTPGGRVWAYASVIDVLSRDPTTIPLSRPWVIGPAIT